MERDCINFRCIRRRGYFCCADCRERDVCRNPCQNGPERCGFVREKVPSSYEAVNFAQAMREKHIPISRQQVEPCRVDNFPLPGGL